MRYCLVEVLLLILRTAGWCELSIASQCLVAAGVLFSICPLIPNSCASRGAGDWMESFSPTMLIVYCSIGALVGVFASTWTVELEDPVPVPVVSVLLELPVLSALLDAMSVLLELPVPVLLVVELLLFVMGVLWKYQRLPFKGYACLLPLARLKKRESAVGITVRIWLIVSEVFWGDISSCWAIAVPIATDVQSANLSFKVHPFFVDSQTVIKKDLSVYFSV